MEMPIARPLTLEQRNDLVQRFIKKVELDNTIQVMHKDKWAIRFKDGSGLDKKDFM